MSAKDDLQVQDIQLDINDPEDPSAILQLVEWAKQASARQKQLQFQIDRINERLSFDQEKVMSTIARSASCCYPVSNVWLTSQGTDVPDYVDIDEIRLEAKPGHPKSAYLTWVMSNDPTIGNNLKKMDGKRLTRDDHVAMVQFIDNGIRIGSNDSAGIGNDVRGVLKGQNVITRNEYAGYINHPERYRRLYRRGTSIENFWFMGYNES